MLPQRQSSLDAAAVDAVLAGRTDRFAEVVDRHGELVRRAVARSVSDGTSRDDLVAETFARALAHLGDLRQPSKLASWIVSIARACAAEHVRERERRQAAARDAAELARREALPAHRAPAGAWVWDEVARLRPVLAEVLRLRYAAGMKVDDVARQLGVSASTVRGRLYEARRALRRRIERRAQSGAQPRNEP